MTIKQELKETRELLEALANNYRATAAFEDREGRSGVEYRKASDRVYKAAELLGQ